jgi:hypothetical protein
MYARDGNGFFGDSVLLGYDTELELVDVWAWYETPLEKVHIE